MLAHQTPCLRSSEAREGPHPLRSAVSTKRGNSYTMVISRDLGADEFGTGIAVPCYSQDLIKEAEELWAAEDNRIDGPTGCISATFGCVALLENPDLRLPDAVRKEWTDRVAREQDYGNLIRMLGEDRDVVDPCSGFLTTDWPRTVAGSPLEWSALLATATRLRGPKGSCRRYPSPRAIANAWDIPEDRESQLSRKVD